MAKLTTAGRILIGTVILSVLVAGGWTLYKSHSTADVPKSDVVVQPAETSTVEPVVSAPPVNSASAPLQTGSPVLSPSPAINPVGTPANNSSANDAAINELSGMKTMKTK